MSDGRSSIQKCKYIRVYPLRYGLKSASEKTSPFISQNEIRPNPKDLEVTKTRPMVYPGSAAEMENRVTLLEVKELLPWANEPLDGRFQPAERDLEKKGFNYTCRNLRSGWLYAFFDGKWHEFKIGLEGEFIEFQGTYHFTVDVESNPTIKIAFSDIRHFSVESPGVLEESLGNSIVERNLTTPGSNEVEKFNQRKTFVEEYREDCGGLLLLRHLFPGILDGTIGPFVNKEHKNSKKRFNDAYDLDKVGELIKFADLKGSEDDDCAVMVVVPDLLAVALELSCCLASRADEYRKMCAWYQPLQTLAPHSDVRISTSGRVARRVRGFNKKFAAETKLLEENIIPLRSLARQWFKDHLDTAVAPLEVRKSDAGLDKKSKIDNSMRRAQIVQILMRALGGWLPYAEVAAGLKNVGGNPAISLEKKELEANRQQFAELFLRTGDQAHTAAGLLRLAYSGLVENTDEEAPPLPQVSDLAADGLLEILGFMLVATANDKLEDNDVSHIEAIFDNFNEWVTKLSVSEEDTTQLTAESSARPEGLSEEAVQDAPEKSTAQATQMSLASSVFDPTNADDVLDVLTAIIICDVYGLNGEEETTAVLREMGSKLIAAKALAEGAEQATNLSTIIKFLTSNIAKSAPKALKNRKLVSLVRKMAFLSTRLKSGGGMGGRVAKPSEIGRAFNVASAVVSLYQLVNSQTNLARIGHSLLALEAILSFASFSRGAVGAPTAARYVALYGKKTVPRLLARGGGAAVAGDMFIVASYLEDGDLDAAAASGVSAVIGIWGLMALCGVVAMPPAWLAFGVSTCATFMAALLENSYLDKWMEKTYWGDTNAYENISYDEKIFDLEQTEGNAPVARLYNLDCPLRVLELQANDFKAEHRRVSQPETVRAFMWAYQKEFGRLIVPFGIYNPHSDQFNHVEPLGRYDYSGQCYRIAIDDFVYRLRNSHLAFNFATRYYQAGVSHLISVNLTAAAVRACKHPHLLDEIMYYNTQTVFTSELVSYDYAYLSGSEKTKYGELFVCPIVFDVGRKQLIDRLFNLETPSLRFQFTVDFNYVANDVQGGGQVVGEALAAMESQGKTYSGFLTESQPFNYKWLIDVEVV